MKKLTFAQQFGQALIKNVKVTIGDREMSCLCKDVACPHNSHKVELKQKFLSSIYANDVDGYERPEFSTQQTFWFDGTKCFGRTSEEQKKYDMLQEEMLETLKYKSMNVTTLRKMYELLDQNAGSIINSRGEARADLLQTLLSTLKHYI